MDRLPRDPKMPSNDDVADAGARAAGAADVRALASVPGLQIQAASEMAQENQRAFVRRFAAHDPPVGLPERERECVTDQDVEEIRRRLGDADRPLRWEDVQARADTDAAVRLAISDFRASGRADPTATEVLGFRLSLVPIHGTIFLEDFTAARLSLACAWTETLSRWRSDKASRLGAAYVLSAAVAAGEAIAGHTHAIGRLTQAVDEHLPRFLLALGLPLAPAQLEEVGEQDGMFAPYARAAAYIQREIAADRAEVLKTQAREEWAQRATAAAAPEWTRWRDTPPRPARILAAALWPEVRARLEHEETNPPALSLPFVEAITSAQRRGVQIISGTGATHSLGTAKGEAVEGWTIEAPAIEVDGLQAMMRRLASVNAVRTMHYEVVTAHAQHLAEIDRPHVISVPGGWSELARKIGANSKTAPAEVRSVVLAQAHLVWHGADGSRGNLLVYSESDEAPGRRALVRLELGEVLCPKYVQRFTGKESVKARHAKRLVPSLDALPPVIGANALHGPQLVLHWYVLAEFQRRAIELVKNGGVLLTASGFAALAARFQLAGWAPKILDRWTQDGDGMGGPKDGPAFLEMVDVDRYTLGPAHRRARAFLLEAGQRDARGPIMGRLGAAAKRRKWTQGK